ncbi:MAG: DUF2127 domain-containing protein [Spirochaetes bacterium]|nr:DUF2127 domain-containing protein [Spirochaetota bacterium]
MKKIRISAIIMIFHGALLEIGAIFLYLPSLISKDIKFNIPDFANFIVPYFKENMNLMIVMSFIYGVVRVFGAIGILKNRMWGFSLSVIICSITMVLMVFMLPFGIIDGILSCIALILMLEGYFGKKKI